MHLQLLATTQKKHPPIRWAPSLGRCSWHGHGEAWFARGNGPPADPPCFVLEAPPIPGHPRAGGFLLVKKGGEGMILCPDAECYSLRSRDRKRAMEDSAVILAPMEMATGWASLQKQTHSEIFQSRYLWFSWLFEAEVGSLFPCTFLVDVDFPAPRRIKCINHSLLMKAHKEIMFSAKQNWESMRVREFDDSADSVRFQWDFSDILEEPIGFAQW